MVPLGVKDLVMKSVLGLHILVDKKGLFMPYGIYSAAE